MSSGRRGSHIVLSGESEEGGHRRVSASVAEVIDEEKEITALKLTENTIAMVISLFEKLDADGNGVLEEDDFTSAGVETNNYTTIASYFDHDESPLTINKFFLGLKNQALAPGDPENSPLYQWIQTLNTDANTDLSQYGVQQVIDEAQGKLNDTVFQICKDFNEWLTKVDRDECIVRKEKDWTKQLDEDFSTVTCINFTERTWTVLTNLWDGLDADKSDDLTMDDLKTLCPGNKILETWEALADVFDNDKNGSIDSDEFRIAFINKACGHLCNFAAADAANGSFPWKGSILQFLEEVQANANKAIEAYAFEIAAYIPAIGDINPDMDMPGDYMQDTSTGSTGGAAVWGQFTLDDQTTGMSQTLFRFLSTGGKIDNDDIHQKLAAVAGHTAQISEQWEELRQIMDSDGDGEIDYDEFQSAMVTKAMNHRGGANITSLPDVTNTTIQMWHNELNGRLNVQVQFLLGELSDWLGVRHLLN